MPVIFFILSYIVGIEILPQKLAIFTHYQNYEKVNAAIV